MDHRPVRSALLGSVSPVLIKSRMSDFNEPTQTGFSKETPCPLVPYPVPAVPVIVLTGCKHLKPETLLSSITGPETQGGHRHRPPPLAYKKDGVITGLEAKFAAGLARSTGRTLELVELPRQGLARPCWKERSILSWPE